MQSEHGGEPDPPGRELRAVQRDDLGGERSGMRTRVNALLFPPALLKRALDDLSAIGDAARRLPRLEMEVIDRIDRIQDAAFARVDAIAEDIRAMRDGVEGMRGGLDGMRDGLGALRGDMAGMRDELAGLRDDIGGMRGDLAPTGDLGAVRAGVERLPEELRALREEMRPIQQLDAVREGIDPLDDDMRAVRQSVDELEPLIREVSGRLETLRADLSPLGELADRIPGINRR